MVKILIFLRYTELFNDLPEFVEIYGAFSITFTKLYFDFLGQFLWDGTVLFNQIWKVVNNKRSVIKTYGSSRWIRQKLLGQLVFESLLLFLVMVLFLRKWRMFKWLKKSRSLAASIKLQRDVFTQIVFMS